MKFGPVPVGEALGAILAHGVRAGEQRLRKGRVLAAPDIETLKAAGVAEIVAARLEADDVPEDEAAARLARACAGANVRVGAAFTGRANLYAERRGIAVIDAAAIAAIDAVDESITVATLQRFSRVEPGAMLATVKVIPFAAPRAALVRAEAIPGGEAVRVAPFVPHRIGLISTAFGDTRSALLDKNRAALDARVVALGSAIAFERRVPHRPAELAAAISEMKARGADPILVFGASAITDRRDVIPAAIEQAGGRILRFGMPVDPGNLLLLGEIDGAAVVGLPGCARSPKLNGFDFILWRLLADLPASAEEIAAMGVGGLLAEIATRPQPRDAPLAEAPRAPRIAAVVLAAGLSSRMASNKLLAPLDGKPLLRHAVEAAVASAAEPVIVVTGKDAEAARAALDGLSVRFVHNPDFAGGLSTSLKAGIAAVPEDCDGAMILLGDMPGVSSALIDRLIAAFSPEDARAICVATHAGKRGNPVLWARRFFADIAALTGDVGARHLVAVHEELVREVEAGDDAPLADIDTAEALAAYRSRRS
ncbi:MAG TPA: molybdopterin-binding/glycosyltransferase family 2 protein [Rhizomicrobium sp.]|nr:molybdopterin-binding/glycosyltransferase family 2 protein [Rhizomicrobium sp.]